MTYTFVKVKPSVYEAVQFNKPTDHGRVFQGYIDSASGKDVCFITDSIPRSPTCRRAFILCTGPSGNLRLEIKVGDWIVNKIDSIMYKPYSNKDFLKKFIGTSNAPGPLGIPVPEVYA
jgi:hypothetical protein